MFYMHFKLLDQSCVNAQRFQDFMQWMKQEGFISWKDADLCWVSFSDNTWGRGACDERGEKSFLKLLKPDTHPGLSVVIRHAAGYGGQHIKNKTTDLVKEVQQAVASFADERGYTDVLDIYTALNVGWVFCEDEDEPIFSVSLGGDGYWPDAHEFILYAFENCALLRKLVQQFERSFAGQVVIVQ